MLGLFDGSVDGRLLGIRDGVKDGNLDGVKDGDLDGVKDGNLDGVNDGDLDGIKDGDLDGDKDGNLDGVEDGDLDGVEDGDLDGVKDGNLDGVEDGNLDGVNDGDLDGVEDGDLDGVNDGDLDGVNDGDLDGVRDGQLFGIALGVLEDDVGGAPVGVLEGVREGPKLGCTLIGGYVDGLIDGESVSNCDVLGIDDSIGLSGMSLGANVSMGVEDGCKLSLVSVTKIDGAVLGIKSLPLLGEIWSLVGEFDRDTDAVDGAFDNISGLLLVPLVPNAFPKKRNKSSLSPMMVPIASTPIKSNRTKKHNEHIFLGEIVRDMRDCLGCDALELLL